MYMRGLAQCGVLHVKGRSVSIPETRQDPFLDIVHSALKLQFRSSVDPVLPDEISPPAMSTPPYQAFVILAYARPY